MIHLDTSFLIRALDPASVEDHKLRDWIGRGETLGMSTIAWAELLCGPLSSSEMEWAAEIVGQHRDFTAEHAVIAARLFNESRQAAWIVDRLHDCGGGARRRRLHRDRECNGFSPVRNLRSGVGVGLAPVLTWKLHFEPNLDFQLDSPCLKTI